MKMECLQEIVKEARSLGIRCEINSIGLTFYIKAESRRFNHTVKCEIHQTWYWLITNNDSWKDVIISGLRREKTAVDDCLLNEISKMPKVKNKFKLNTHPLCIRSMWS